VSNVGLPELLELGVAAPVADLVLVADAPEKVRHPLVQVDDVDPLHGASRAKAPELLGQRCLRWLGVARKVAGL